MLHMPLPSTKLELQLKYRTTSLGWLAQLIRSSSPTPKCWEFNVQSGYIPRLRVRSMVGENMGDNQLMFLSHTDVSLSLSHQ